MAEPSQRVMTVDEFYLWQLDQDERYELVDGVPRLHRRPPGADNRHDTIIVNAIGEIGGRLKGKPCRVASAVTALRLGPRTARRADLFVEAAPPRDECYEALVPRAIVDVLAPTTRLIDRFVRYNTFRRLPTVRHILLVDPDAVAALHSSRPEGGEWVDTELRGVDAVIDLSAIDVSLPLGALYDRLEIAN